MKLSNYLKWGAPCMSSWAQPHWCLVIWFRTQQYLKPLPPKKCPRWSTTSSPPSSTRLRSPRVSFERIWGSSPIWRSGPVFTKHLILPLKVRSHQMRINHAICAKLDAWTFWVYSLHSRVKFTTQQTWIRVMGEASARQLQSRFKMYSCFCKSTKIYIQLRVPTYNHHYFVLHCCFGFSASARNDVTARASSWLVNAPRISAKVQIFQLALFKRLIRAASFARIAPQDCLSHLCIDLTCKSFARFASFASGVNAP